MVFMVPTKNARGSSGMPLPSEGIHDPNGHLFHHSSALSMPPEGVKRLREHGITYENKKRFCKEEDAVLEANCAAFCSANNLTTKELLHYAGFGSVRGTHSGELTEFRRRTQMWPRLCHGLVSRCANGVRQRIVRVFHPRIMADRPFTEADDIYLQQMAKRFPIPAVCDIVSRSYSSIRDRLLWLQSRGLFSHSERRKLWNTVSALVQGHSSVVDWYFPEPTEEVWLEVSKSMCRHRKALLQEWNAMVAELEALRDEGVVTWNEALDSVAPECPWISAADFSEFIEIFVDEVPSLENLRLNRIQKKKIAEQMRTCSVSGFHTGRRSEFQFCLLRMGSMLSVLRRRLLRPASLRLSLSTQLRLLSRCLRSLPGAEKSQRFVLTRSLVIKQIERQMTSDNLEWKLSRKLRRYIEGEKE